MSLKSCYFYRGISFCISDNYPKLLLRKEIEQGVEVEIKIERQKTLSKEEWARLDKQRKYLKHQLKRKLRFCFPPKIHFNKNMTLIQFSKLSVTKQRPRSNTTVISRNKQSEKIIVHGTRAAKYQQIANKKMLRQMIVFCFITSVPQTTAATMPDFTS